LHYFYSETENGIKTQIWCTLIAQLLLMVLKAKTKTKKAFSTMAVLLRIHPIQSFRLVLVDRKLFKNLPEEEDQAQQKPCYSA
jgi:hypothetical protein